MLTTSPPFIIHLSIFIAQGEILESHVTIGKNTCSDVGIYEFTMGSTGAKVKGRYSFVYVWEDGEWKINHHHSSVMPEGTMAQVSVYLGSCFDSACPSTIVN
jgi:hypothetical protein